ncbi:MAG: hypothetical protein IT165_06300 [Bryobacterales bacterium]|nr:hypothetical protein [Bryobacterales bacterium]
MTVVSKPGFWGDLTPSEQRFLAAMKAVGFGRFEYIQIRDGQIVLDPWPTAVRDVKFGVEPVAERPQSEHQLKRQVAEFFEYTRDVDAGEIRALEIRHGLPFSMEVELAASRRGGRS